LKIGAAPLALLVFLAPAARAETEAAPACLKWWGESWARGFGYDHVVFIDNACSAPADCVVTTDVAPEPIRAVAPAKQKIDRTAFRGSPSRAFKPKVVCTIATPRRAKPRDE
jgi:hypothetical protein